MAHPFKEGFANSTDKVFLASTLVVLIAFVLVLFWKEVPLRTVGGLRTHEAKPDTADDAAV